MRADAKQVEVVPPSWRRDLTREIDLVEEVGRIHGYDAIPEDVSVPMASSHRTQRDRVLAAVREALVAGGVDEAMTISLVEEMPSEAFSPWTDAPALVSATPVFRRADRLRRSLIPSLLLARKNNEAVGNPRIELFEIARVYLPKKGFAAGRGAAARDHQRRRFFGGQRDSGGDCGAAESGRGAGGGRLSARAVSSRAGRANCASAASGWGILAK